VNAAEALELYRHAPTHLLGHSPIRFARAKHPERIVTYIIDRNVNYTNVCVAAATSARSTARRIRDGYVLGFDEIFRRSTRRSPSAAISCCCRAATIPTCRSRGTRICFAR
jgi:cyclic dehypoxanthinyl futalosine synthase